MTGIHRRTQSTFVIATFACGFMLAATAEAEHPGRMHAYRGPAPRPVIAIPPPPAGNLGRTYRQRTRATPVDKHPRVGMLEIVPPKHSGIRKIENGEILVKLSATGMKAYFDTQDKRWHMESEQPLIPGVPHVFDVKAELVRVETVLEAKWGKKYHKQVETVLENLGYRAVRLIRGRVVEIDWIESLTPPEKPYVW